MLYLEKNILFVGDATGMFVWLFAKETTDLTTYVEAVQKMYDLDAVSYIGAHNRQFIIVWNNEITIFIKLHFNLLINQQNLMHF